MFRLLSYLLSKGVVTSRTINPPLEEGVRGLPDLTNSPCKGSGCNACVEVCPTSVINVLSINGSGKITLDLGGCIACGLCVDNCPTGTIVNDPDTRVAAATREGLILTNDEAAPLPAVAKPAPAGINWFRRSVAARVVSTGCSACDLEIGASGNPIFDLERFGVHIVASPRFADVLMVTGPVSLGMQGATKSCYEAMSSPRKVIAVGTCAISGGMHRGGYAQAQGITDILPVDVFIPGCPPHPWNIIHGVRVAMGQDKPRELLRSKKAKSATARPVATF